MLKIVLGPIDGSSPVTCPGFIFHSLQFYLCGGSRSYRRRPYRRAPPTVLIRRFEQQSSVLRPPHRDVPRNGCAIVADVGGVL